MSLARIRVRDVQAAAVAVLGLSWADLTGKSRDLDRRRKCQHAMLAARRLTGASTTAIGRRFGRDHTTVLFGVRAAAARIAASPQAAAQIDLLSARAAEEAARAEALWQQIPAGSGPGPEGSAP